MTRDIWKATVWYAYLSPQGIRAKARELTAGELRPGEIPVGVFRGVSRKTALSRVADAVRKLYAERRAKHDAELATCGS